MPTPSLTRHDVPDPRALILMLHGGRANGLDLVDEKSASWRRSRWMMSHISGRGAGARTGIWLLRYGVRGWNGGHAEFPSPVPDARWALDEVRRELGDLPVVLLGHSMGGRTAVAVADDPNVTGVVALAPWWPAGESPRALRGKHLAAAHGSADRITSSAATREFVRRAEPVAASTEFHDMGRAGHYMFRSIRAWNRFAIDRSLAFTEKFAGTPE
jgi:pimeloyl-ACP methyl ester carboxylesterase